MDVAALELNANVNAYADLEASQLRLADAMGGAQPMAGMPGLRGMSTGLNQITSSIKFMSILNAEQIKVLELIAGIIGVSYAAMQIISAIKAMREMQVTIAMVQAAYETVIAAAIPIIGEIAIGAAIGATLVVMAAFSDMDRTIEAQSIASGTERRRLARAVAP